MNHKVEFISTKQVGFQLDNQKTKMIKWDVATVPFPIASVRRLTMQVIEQRNGKKTELVVHGKVQWLKAKIFSAPRNGVEIRALEDRAER